MLTALQVVLLLAGLVLLVAGYRRDRRGLLATAAVVLFVAGALRDFVEGVVLGFHASAGT